MVCPGSSPLFQRTAGLVEMITLYPSRIYVQNVVIKPTKSVGIGTSKSATTLPDLLQ